MCKSIRRAVIRNTTHKAIRRLANDPDALKDLNDRYVCERVCL
jgi:hypothetical protein